MLTSSVATCCPFGCAASVASWPFNFADLVASEKTAVSVILSPTVAEVIGWFPLVAVNEITATCPVPRSTCGETTAPSSWVCTSILKGCEIAALAVRDQRVVRVLGGNVLLARRREAVAEAVDVDGVRVGGAPLDLQLDAGRDLNRVRVLLRAVVGIELDAGGDGRRRARGRRGGGRGCGGISGRVGRRGGVARGRGGAGSGRRGGGGRGRRGGCGSWRRGGCGSWRRGGCGSWRRGGCGSWRRGGRGSWRRGGCSSWRRGGRGCWGRGGRGCWRRGGRSCWGRGGRSSWGRGGRGSWGRGGCGAGAAVVVACGARGRCVRRGGGRRVRMGRGGRVRMGRGGRVRMRGRRGRARRDVAWIVERVGIGLVLQHRRRVQEQLLVGRVARNEARIARGVHLPVGGRAGEVGRARVHVRLELGKLERRTHRPGHRVDCQLRIGRPAVVAGIGVLDDRFVALQPATGSADRSPRR